MTEALETFAFNVAVARAYELLGALVGDRPADAALLWARREAIEILARLVSPMIPHVAEAANMLLNPGAALVAMQPWPEPEPALLVKDELTVAVQVNGKLKGTITIAAGTDAAVAVAIAKAAVAGALKGQTIVKEIYVAGRIVNFVVKP